MPLEGTSTIEGEHESLGPRTCPYADAETVARVRAYIEADPDILSDKSRYVEGWGWDHTKWLLEEWPTYVRPVVPILPPRR